MIAINVNNKPKNVSAKETFIELNMVFSEKNSKFAVYRV